MWMHIVMYVTRRQMLHLRFKSSLVTILLPSPIQSPSFDLKTPTWYGASEMRDCLFLIISTCSFRSVGRRMLQIPPAKEFHLMGPRKQAFLKWPLSPGTSTSDAGGEWNLLSETQLYFIISAYSPTPAFIILYSNMFPISSATPHFYNLCINFWD